MRVALSVVLVGALAVAVPGSAQDWKGAGRMEGTVTDADGKPIAGAIVKLNLAARGGGTSTKTDKKGHWAVLGLASGDWALDFEAEGFVTRMVTVPLHGFEARVKVDGVKLEKPKGPPPELLEAVKRGDDAYKAGRYPEARAEYEKVLAMRPELGPTLHQLIARCYGQEQNYPKELEHLQFLLDADPTNTNLLLLIAQEALKGGMLDRGMELLSKIDGSAITDPNIHFNVAVLLLNQQKPDEALIYLDKAVALDAKYADGYFQRALVHLQLQHLPQAKDDFKKLLELEPVGAHADLATKALEQLK